MKHTFQQLSLRFRPKNFGQFIGQDKVLAELSEDMNGDSPSTRLLFYGQSGAGKTSLARVVALSLQCRHKKFGYPCLTCRKDRVAFDIVSVPCAKLTAGKEKSASEVLESFLSAAGYYPSHGSRKRVFILDEPQRLSQAAQEYLFDVLENAPNTSVFILCTTKRSALLRPMRRRCTPYKLQPLDESSIRKLVSITLGKLELKEKFSTMKLSEALLENDITSPGFIMVAIQKYISGASEKDAAQVDQDSEFDHKALTRCITSGDWNEARQQLKMATLDDARGIRNGVASYLRAGLVDYEEMDGNADVMAKAIDKLSKPVDDGIVLPLITSIVYSLCKIFRRNPR